jgi:glutathione synthase/RimK-type ligase-like ATP-grasp enzyme
LAGVRSGGPRVVKQNRGNAGQGVWKVEWLDQPANAGPIVRVLEARRGSAPETLWLEEFISRCEAYFGWGGCIIDQPF